MKATEGRVLIKADPKQKNQYKLADGVTIQLERDVENLDKKYTAQSLGKCVDSENIPKGAMILFHHNSVHPVNEIANHDQISGDDIANGIKIYSITESSCYLWKMPNEKEWQPTKGFATALRVFEPYKGALEGVKPNKLENVLYLTSGEYKGLVCLTIKAADYEITFLNEQGKDEKIIRLRPDGDEKENREPEVIAINHQMTEMVNKGKLLIGLSISDCKTLKEYNG